MPISSCCKPVTVHKVQVTFRHIIAGVNCTVGLHKSIITVHVICSNFEVVHAATIAHPPYLVIYNK